MPFEKGKSGNPGGRPKEKIITDALRLAAMRDDKRRVNDLAEKVWTLALAGEAWAVNFVTDHLEGKVPMAVGGDEDLAPIKTVLEVAWKASMKDASSAEGSN